MSIRTRIAVLSRPPRPRVGLALGSGGARGLAHIGVIKVLEREGITIDLIAGSSIGALIGAFYGVTGDIAAVEHVACATDRKRLFSFLDPSFVQGILRGDGVRKFLDLHLGRTRCEDLRLPLAVVTTDYKDGKTVVIREGLLASAVRASIAIPVILRPIERDGRLLADGGLSVPVPVTVARSMGADIVIAVNLDADYSRRVATKDLSLFKIADLSVEILQYHLAAHDVATADVVIAPDNGAVGWNEFLDAPRVIAGGEAAAAAALPAIRRALAAWTWRAWWRSLWR